MEIKVGVDIIRHVISPEHDWSVLYFDNLKIWEGDSWNGEAFEAITKSLDAEFYMYEFTDEDEIDGETPDSFVHIQGIKEIKD